MPKVSIIIPSYNVENYIAKGIESACAQSERNIEIVVIDDGSTDNTWNIIEDFAEKDSRIKAVHQENGGVSSARNHALDIAEGEYVIFLDSDDWLEPQTVECLLSKVEPDKKEIICSECYYVDILDGSYKRNQQGVGNTCTELTREKTLSYIGRSSFLKLHSACYKLFSKKIIDSKLLRFEQDIHQGEDGLFTFNYLLEVDTVKYITEPLWNILDRPGSACNSGYNKKWKSAIAAIDMMLQHREELSEAVVNNLYAFKAERAMWIINGCLRSATPDYEDVNWAKGILKEYSRFLIARNKSLKTRAQCYLIVHLPNPLLRPLLKITEH